MVDTYLYKFLEDHIDLRRLEMVEDPRTTSSRDDKGVVTYNTSVKLLYSGKSYSWGRSGDTGRKTVEDAHADLIKHWKEVLDCGIPLTLED